jgi:serine/threonine protein kinase
VLRVDSRRRAASLLWMPQVVTLKDLIVREVEDELYVVMELMDSDLHRIIQSDQPLNDAHFKHFMYQLLRGLHFTHKNGVLHRDLKPGNLLVTKNCDLRVCTQGRPLLVTCIVVGSLFWGVLVAAIAG